MISTTHRRIAALGRLAAAIITTCLGACTKEQPAPAASAAPTSAPAAAKPSTAPAATPAASATAKPQPAATPAQAAKSTPAPAAADKPAANAADASAEGGNMAQSKVDQADLEAKCAKAGLPKPPNVANLPADYVRVLAKAVDAAAQNPTADTIGRVGCIYHVICRDRDDSDRITECYKKAKTLDPKSAAWPYYLGRLHLARVSYESGRIELLKAGELSPDAARAYYWLGNLEMERKSAAEALVQYKKYSELVPDCADGYAGIAAASVELGNLDDARTAVEKALSMAPNHGNALRALNAVENKQGHYAEGVEALAKANTAPNTPGAITRDPLELNMWRYVAPTQVGVGRLGGLLTSRDYDSAKVLAASYLADNPQNAWLASTVADAFLMAGQLDEGFTYARKAREINPQYGPGASVMANCLLKKGSLDEAMTEIQEAIKLSPKLSPAHLTHGRILFAQKKYDEAAEAFMRAKETQPNNPFADLGLAEVYLTQGKRAEGKAALAAGLDTAYALDTFPPSLLQSILTLAQLELEDGQLDEAVVQMENALKINPTRDDVFLQMADALFQRKRGTEAIEKCRGLYEKNPGLHVYALILGELVARNGRPDKAVEYLKKLSERLPKHPGIPLRIAKIRLDQGLAADAARRAEYFGDAKAQLERSIELQDTIDESYVLLSIIAMKEKDQPGALRMLRKGLDKVPNSARLLNSLAWTLSTSPDEKIRNPQEAVAAAEKACNMTQRAIATLLDTLACSYASAGRFDEAIETSQEAIRMAKARPGQGDPAEYAARLEMFQDKKPYIDKE